MLHKTGIAALSALLLAAACNTVADTPPQDTSSARMETLFLTLRI